MAKISYGGQAVLEGVMMRGPTRMAVAVRRPDGQISVRQRPFRPWTAHHRVLGWPIIRGVVALFDSLWNGMEALMYSANEQADEGEELSKTEMTLTMAVGIGIALLLFVALPSVLSNFLHRVIGHVLLTNLLEGAVRVLILLGYIIAISRMKDIERVLQYHGAEHMAIWAYEKGEPLTVESARRQSALHPRCGTSFLLFVVLVSVLVFAFLGWPGFWLRIASRLLLMPVVAGLSYEVLRFTGTTDAAWVRWLSKPGMWLQKFTTRPPDDSMLEVALAALEAARDEEAEQRVAAGLPAVPPATTVQAAEA